MTADAELWRTVRLPRAAATCAPGGAGWTRWIPRGGSLLVWAMLLCTPSGGWAQPFDDRLDMVMYADPGFPSPVVRVELSSDLQPLWGRALQRPAAELQRLAADTVVIAHRMGMQNLADLSEQLIAVLNENDRHPAVSRAAARALVTLDVPSAASPLADAVNRGDLEVASIVEPALARWRYEAAADEWLQRLSDPHVEPQRMLVAIECLATTEDRRAVPPLMALCQDRDVRLPIRLAAARAAGRLDTESLVPAARQLADAGGPEASLLAATLVAHHRSAAAADLLIRFAGDPSTVVQGLALRCLMQIDPRRVYPLIPQAVRSDDANVRQIAAEALAHQAEAQSVAHLGHLLDDWNPGLRRRASKTLVDFARRDALRGPVVALALDKLAGDSWRELEQSAIVLAELDHHAAAPRLVELLKHRRPEVAVSAAWALSRLQVDEVLPDMLAHANSQWDALKANQFEEKYIDGVDHQFAHLFQAFGLAGYRPADPLMRRFIPKQTFYGGYSRVAAVWALGKLYQGEPVGALADAFAARLSDTNPDEPEVDEVRGMAAVGLGRMGVHEKLPVLRRFVREEGTPTGYGCAWAIEQLTGEKTPINNVIVTGASNWFLAPIADPGR